MYICVYLNVKIYSTSYLTLTFQIYHHAMLTECDDLCGNSCRNNYLAGSQDKNISPYLSSAKTKRKLDYFVKKNIMLYILL